MQRVQVLKSGKFKFIKNVKGKAAPKAKPKAKPGGKANRTSPKKQGGTSRMARKKSSVVNRVANLALLLLTFATPIRLALLGQWGAIVFRSTGGLAGNPQTGAPPTKKLDFARLGEFYGPVAAGLILFEVKKMAMKKFRF